MYGPFADATAMSAAYAAQLDGLTVTQAEVALSTTGLSAAQQEEILTLYRGAAALTEYSVQQLAAKVGLNETKVATLLNCQSTDQLTYSNLMLLMSTTELEAGEKARIASLMAQTGATAALDGATKGLNMTLGATLKLMLASPMGKLSILLTVLPIIIGLIKKMAEAYNDAHPSLDAMKTDLDGLKQEEAALEQQSSELNDRIKELQALKDAGTISLTEEEELGRLERENELLKQQIELQKQLIAGQEDKVHDKAVEDAEKFFSSSGSAAVNGKTAVEVDIEQYKKAKAAYDKAFAEGDSDAKRKFNERMQEEREALTNWHTQLLEWRKDLNEDTDSELISNIDDMADAIAELLGVQETGLPDSLKEAYDAYQKLKDSVGEEGVKGSDEFKTLEEEASKVGLTIEQVTERMGENGAAAAAEAEELEKLKASATGAAEGLSKLQEEQSLVASASKEQSESGYLSVETYDKLIAASSDYASCIEYENGSMQLNTDKAKELTDAKYELQLQEIELAKAQDVAKWKENAADIADLESRYASLSDTELAHLASLQSENGVLEQNIQKYNVMKSEIIELTGAYREWLDAQNGPESGDMYDSLKTAQKAIEEGLESGKTGTAKYKSALKLLVPEDAKADAAAYMQNLQRYISDDSTGVSNFIHDMVVAGLMIEDGDNVQLVPNTAIQDICEKLHITPEMAKAIFGELEEYDFNFDWEDEDFEFNTDTSALDEINAKIAEAKQRIAEIQASTIDPQVKTEQLNAAKQDLQQLVQDKASLETPTEADVTTNSETAKTDLSEITGTLDEIAEKVDTVAAKKIGTLGAEKTSSSLQGIINRLNRINNIKIKDKSFTVTQVNVGGGKGGIPGFSSANGTQSAPGGRTLVGELGRELVVSGDRYFTVGDLGAEFVNLKAGDIVFNHEDTEKLLKGLTGVRGMALAQGTAMAGRVSGGGSLKNLSTYKTTSASVTSASTVQSRTTANVNVNVKTGAKDLSEALEDQLKTLKEELDDILDQFDFKIFIAEKQNASANEIIAIYKKMQETVHAQAEKYRKMGVDENNEYIRDLKKQWWEYEEAIREARKDEFDDWLSDSKFAIEAMEHDHEGTDKMLESWRTILKSINDEIAYYTARGYDMASDEIQDLLKEAWGAENEIEEILSSALDAVNDSIDQIQDLYKTLKDAANEYAETGYISMDVYQEIVNLGVEYMSYLRDENGVLRINRERIEAVLTAKTQQLAVESALNYVRKIGDALAKNETIELQRLLNATEQTADATWGLVYANLAFLDLTDKQRAAARKNIDNMRAIANNVSANISKSLAAEDENGSLGDTQDALNDILDLTKDLIKHEHEQMMDALDDQLDAYRKIVDEKKRSLDLSRSELSYNKDIQNRTQEIAKIQARLAALSNDDSREAAIERRKLQEELAEKQADLEEKQRDHAIDMQKESLDKQVEMQEEAVKARKEELERETSSEQKLYDLAIARINSDWETLESQLLAYNTEYGRSLNTEIIDKWGLAKRAAEEYGDFVSALNAKENTDDGSDIIDSDIVGESEVFQDAERINQIATQMQKNSLQWYGASESERRNLERDNESMAKELEQYTNSGIYKKGGAWYRADGSLLYQLSEDDKYAAIVAAMKQNSMAWWTASDEERSFLHKRNQELAGYTDGKITNKNGVWVGADGKPVYTISGQEKEAIARQLVSMMKENSNAWNSASASGRQQLADENVRLAKSVASLLNANVSRDANGVWMINGKRLYDVYHKGGVVGGRNRGDKEQFALLERGEWVLAQKQKDALTQMIEMSKFVKERSAELAALMPDISAYASGRRSADGVSRILQARKEGGTDQVIHVDASLTVTGIVDEQVLQVIQRHPKAVAEQVSKVII